MARKGSKKRAIEQRERSQRDREKAAALAKPSRDDVARTALWLWIWSAWRFDKDARKSIDLIRDNIVDQMVAQGFDLRQSEERFEELAEKYKSDLPPFRIKRHLQKRQGGALAEPAVDGETG
ncbi:MAG: hypothetical protein KL863_28615 [Rhizobium sp.]|nr:hypothetical protein [Rhizobium sp.]